MMSRLCFATRHRALCLSVMCSILFLLTSCEKDKDEDSTAPDITITFPANHAVVVGDSVMFAGTTSGEADIASIAWETSSGHEGVVSGDLSAWSALVDLDYGDIEITFTVTDNAGNRSAAQVDVVSNQFLALTQQTRITPTAAITDDAVALQAFCALDPSSIGSNGSRALVSVELVHVTDVVHVLGALTDDGNLANGDEIQGDNIYTIFTTYTFAEDGDQHLRVRATYQLAGGGTFHDYSEIRAIQVVPGVETQDLQAVVDGGGEAWSHADSLITDGATIAQAATQTAHYLEDLPEIASATVSDDGNVVWYETTAGLKGNILLAEDGTRGGRGRSSGRGGPLLTEPYSWAAPRLQQEDVSSNNVVIFDAFNSQFAPFDEAPALSELFQNSPCPHFNVSYYVDGQCTVDVVSSFSQYGTVILVTHGGTQDGQVFFMTRQLATANLLSDHEADMVLDKLTVTTMEGQSYFSILPGFIADLGDFPGSIVYNGSCESSSNGTMSNAFLGNGAMAYLGFTRVVNSDFAQTVSMAFFTSMVTDHESSSDAFTTGQVDPGDPHATFTLASNEDTHYTSDFSNGGFETGDLSGWTRTGDGRVITALGSTLPTSGAFMGIISTGLGFTTSSGSITASICEFSEDAELTLSFDWNYFSEEFLEFCGSIYQDFFTVVVEVDGVESTLFYRRVDDLCSSVASSDVSFDMGGVYDTGWHSEALSLPTITAGQSVSISFRAGDVGDSIYDTAVLIDNISLE